MPKWYLHEIAVSGVMDVLIFVPFALAFYYLGKWYMWMWFKKLWILLLALNKKMDLLLYSMNINADDPDGNKHDEGYDVLD